MSDQEELDLSSLKARLLAQRDELLRQNVDHADELKPVELDQARLGRLSRMDAMQSQALSAELQRRREMDLRRIEEALQRMDDGDYGYCVTCGESINPKRLENRAHDQTVRPLRQRSGKINPPRGVGNPTLQEIALLGRRRVVRRRCYLGFSTASISFSAASQSSVSCPGAKPRFSALW